MVKGSQSGRNSPPVASPSVRLANKPARDEESVADEQSPRLAFPVVGIGGSAGGLEAFLEFFGAMPGDTGMAFVIIQHLPPDRESMIASILATRTPMRVTEVEDGIAVEPNNVYVIRPAQTMTIRDGRLWLREPLEKVGHRCAVDDFFRSLAEEQRERAIAIVMSGMGSNGSFGAQTMKAVGGVCIAQDPSTAKFPSMPRHLIDTGLADFILAAGDMPQFLVRYAKHPYSQKAGREPEEEGIDREALVEIISILRTRMRHDFSGYKKPTILRRVERRMGLQQINSMTEYSRLLRQNPGEVSSLSDDLMIHVTGFFRDSEVWQAMLEQAITPLLQSRGDDRSIRVWVSACATGEEAYTVAMLLLEASSALDRQFDIKIFATDPAERTLTTARAGIFPAGIEAEISPERLARFFDKDDAIYRIKKEVRELVIFAPQNILQDPPFSRLDICTCRNLLIYLEPEVQRRAISLIHFALREGGTLLLGNSETIAGAEDMFEPIDKKFRIFRRIGVTRHGAVDFPAMNPFPPVADADLVVARAARLTLAQITNKALLERFSPTAVVVDRQLNILYFHGHTELYLDQPRGEPTRDLMVLARENVRGSVRAATQKAIGQNSTAIVRDGAVDTPAGRIRFQVTVTPLDSRPIPLHFMVIFEERVESPATVPPIPAETLQERQQLADELTRAREELQSTVEELQSSNEELKAANEEAASVNEELQSSNEELETSKEELQSLNEELTTVNAQLQTKMEELERTGNDLSSLLSSTDIAVVFLDTNFRIRRYTPAVKDLLELIPSDIGRPLSDLARKFADEDLLRDAQLVLDRLVPVEREISSDSGRAFTRRVLPYRTTDNRIGGVVITFVDVSARRLVEDALRENEERNRLILAGVTEYAIFMLDQNGRIATWSVNAERILGFSQAEAIGQTMQLIMPPGSSGRIANEFALAKAGQETREEGWHVRKDGKEFWASGMMGALTDTKGHARGFVKVLRDATDRKNPS